MDADDVVWASGHELVELMGEGEVSPTEVMQTFLDRIERLEPTLRAFINTDPEGAMRQAVAAEAALAAGEPTGPLFGLPVAVKDNLWTIDMPTTAGSVLYEDFMAPDDSLTVARIRAAGGIVVGKTNMPEFAAWPRTVSLVREECVNPWNTNHLSGSSSGGSGAAAAAALAPLTIGTDGGGSTRLPAAMCGVVGVQPSKGIVPSVGRVGASQFAGIGPMTRDVRDAARLLTVIGGPDPRDPMSDGTVAVDYEVGLDDDIGGLRFAYAESMGDFPPNAAVNAVVRAALDDLEPLVGRLADTGVRFDGHSEAFFALNIGRPLYEEGAELAAGQTDEVLNAAKGPDAQKLLAPYTLGRLAAHATVERSVYDDAVAWLADAGSRLDALFSEVDFLVCATAPFVAPRCPDDAWSMPWESMGEYVINTGLANLLRLTAISVPCGFVDGLPVGLQLIGPRATEAKALRVARTLEKVRPWAQVHPSV